MSRLPFTSLRLRSTQLFVTRPAAAAAAAITPRYLSTTTPLGKEPEASQNSTTGWKGRPIDDHVVHRDGNDAQSAPSQQAMKDKAAGKEGSQAISQKDEGNFNEKAKETTKAPGPVIGMNDERGGKGH